MISKFFIKNLIFILILTTTIKAASTNSTKCDVACSSNPLCSTGTCSMTKCQDDSGTGCLNFCLRCAGIIFN
jgi:hypothetical protein